MFEDTSVLEEDVKFQNQKVIQDLVSKIQEVDELNYKHRKRIKELEEALDDSMDSYQTSLKLVESKTITIEVLKGQLENLQVSYSEERKERRDLQKQILTFTGVIPKEVIQGEAQVEIKFEPVNHTKTRGSIKRALEKRALDILERQKAQEDQAIANGELAVIKDIQEVPGY